MDSCLLIGKVHCTERAGSETHPIDHPQPRAHQLQHRQIQPIMMLYTVNFLGFLTHLEIRKVGVGRGGTGGLMNGGEPMSRII
jgi:hypothetical protein